MTRQGISASRVLRTSAIASAMLAAALSLTACAGFFVCEKASCPTTGSGGSTNTYDYVYATNSASGSTYLSGYNIASGALTAITGMPLSLGYTPTVMAIAKSNNFLYIASPGVGTGLPSINLYSIATGTGLVTQVTSAGASVSPIYSVYSMTVSADGNWLLVINVDSTLGVTELTQFQINTTTGILGASSTFALPSSSLGVAPVCNVTQPCAIASAPSGNFIAVALGTAGDALFPFSSSSGITSAQYQQISSGSDFGAVIDSSNYLYLSRTGSETVFPVSAAGIPSTGNSYTTGTGAPRAVVLSTSGGFTYDANYTNSLIYASTISGSAVLTTLNSAGYAAPTDVTALAADSSGNYLLAEGYSSANGLQLYTIAAGGAITAGPAAATGTTTGVADVLVVTH